MSQLNSPDDDELLDSRQLARLLGVNPNWPATARLKGTGPEFVVVSPKIIRYRRRTVEAFLNERSAKSTSTASAA